MDTDATSETYPNSGKKLYPIGFGTTSSGGDSSDDLLVAETFYVPNGQCDDLYGFFGPITSNMICSGDIVNGGVDACQGDSGGPLYDADNDILVGVTSWGIGCADEDFPGVYARVSAQWNEWIKPTICDNHSNPKPCFCDGSCDDDTPTTDDGPTTDDEPTACPAGQVSLTLELMTDDYGEDITWAVIELSGGGSFDVIEAGGAKLNQDYGDNQLYTEELCLPDKCLKFVMYDEYGDGLCCEWGNGGYMVTYDGTLVVSDSFEGIDSSQPHGEPSPLTAITNIGC